jgi:hypothetical protein
MLSWIAFLVIVAVTLYWVGLFIRNNWVVTREKHQVETLHERAALDGKLLAQMLDREHQPELVEDLQAAHDAVCEYLELLHGVMNDVIFEREDQTVSGTLKPLRRIDITQRYPYPDLPKDVNHLLAETYKEQM